MPHFNPHTAAFLINLLRVAKLDYIGIFWVTSGFNINILMYYILLPSFSISSYFKRKGGVNILSS